MDQWDWPKLTCAGRYVISKTVHSTSYINWFAAIIRSGGSVHMSSSAEVGQGGQSKHTSGLQYNGLKMRIAVQFNVTAIQVLKSQAVANIRMQLRIGCCDSWLWHFDSMSVRIASVAGPRQR
jgi:hypothetical protein